MNREEAQQRRDRRRGRKVSITNHEQEAIFDQAAPTSSNPAVHSAELSPPAADSPPPESEPSTAPSDAMPPAGLAGAPPTVANPDAGDGGVPKAFPAQFAHLPRQRAGTEAGDAASRREPRQPDGLVWARYALALGLGLFAPPRGFLCFFLIDILASVVLPWATRQRTAAGLMRAVGSWVRQVWCYWRRSWLIMVIARAAVQVFLSRRSAQTDRGRS